MSRNWKCLLKKKKKTKNNNVNNRHKKIALTFPIPNNR